jgi:DNA-binding MarR family transcriptional regulator
MPAEFVQQKFEWLMAVAADRRLRGLPVSVAVVLAARYFNAKSGEAWPSMATLAKDLNVHWRSVQRSVRKLEDARYLRVSSGSGRASNTYRMHTPGKDAVAKAGTPYQIRQGCRINAA